MSQAAALRAKGVAIYAVGLGPMDDKDTDTVATDNLLAYTGGCRNRVWYQEDFKSSPHVLAPLVKSAINQQSTCKKTV